MIIHCHWSKWCIPVILNWFVSFIWREISVHAVLACLWGYKRVFPKLWLPKGDSAGTRCVHRLNLKSPECHLSALQMYCGCQQYLQPLIPIILPDNCCYSYFCLLKLFYGGYKKFFFKNHSDWLLISILQACGLLTWQWPSSSRRMWLSRSEVWSTASRTPWITS